MWLAAFYILGTLLAFSVCDICPESSEEAASWIRLKALGHCGDEEDFCPYQIILPPLAIQLPKPFRELGKMAKELQNLKEVVNQLRRDCQECKGRNGWTDHSEEEIRPQSPIQNIGNKETQSHSHREQAVRILTSTLLQGDSDGIGVKRLDHSILEGEEWTTDSRTDLNQGTVFNPSPDQVPDDISQVRQVPTFTQTEKELMPKQSELKEPYPPTKKDYVQLATRGKQPPNILRNQQVKNISNILIGSRRVADTTELGSILTDANTERLDLSTSAGNKRVVKFPGVGGTLKPKGQYINSRGVNVNNEDRLNNPALVRKTQTGDLTVKTEPEEAGFSPARSGVMRVKETSPLIANTKPEAMSEQTLSTDQNKQGIVVSGRKTDDGHGPKDASQVIIVRENYLTKVNKTEITRLPTNLRKEKQGTNTSVSSVINQAEQPNIVKEERKHKVLSESLVVINREAETSSAVETEDLLLSGRQVENEKYLNPISGTNNGQIDSTIADKVNPRSTDVKDKLLPETIIEGSTEEIGFNSLNAGTEKKDIPSYSKATPSKDDLLKPTVIPISKSKLRESTESMNRRVESHVVGHGIRKPPLTTKEREMRSQNNKDISKTQEGSQDNVRYVMSNPQRKPKTVIIPRGPKVRQPIIMDKMSENKSVGVPSKLSIPVRNSNSTRKIGSGIIKPNYTRTKPNFQPESNTNRGVKTKVTPTGVTSTVEKEEIKHIPQVITSNILNNHRVKNNNNTDSKSQPDAGDVRDLNKAKEGKDKSEDNSETVLTSNIENSAEDSNILHRETSNSHTGEKERKTFTLVTADINSQHPSETDRISTEKKRPTASTLNKLLSRKPGTTQTTTSTVSFMNTSHEDSTKNIRKVTSNHAEMAKNLSRDASKSSENIITTPQMLDNHWLKNYSGESKSQQASQYVGNVQDVDKVQQDKNQTEEISERLFNSNTKDPKTLQSGTSNSLIGGKERKISSLETTEMSRQSEAETISRGRKRPTAPTLKKDALREPGTTPFTTMAISFTDKGNDDSTKNVRKITNKHVEMTKNLSQDASVRSDNIRKTPSGRSNVLDNHGLKNNRSRSQPESQNAGNVQDLNKVKQGKNQAGDKRETVFTSNTESSAEDPNTPHSEESIPPVGGKDSRISTFRTADTSTQFEGDKISSGKKRPTASTLKKELSKKTGTTLLTTSTVSFTDTDHKDLRTVPNTHVEMTKNISQDTPISFENIEGTRELELIKLNTDRVEENPGEISPNPNTADTAQGSSGGKNTLPVVLEKLTNVEEIKGSKLLSLSPEDTAEGFKSHAVSDDVTKREQDENKIHSTCLSDCNITSTQHLQSSTTQTRPFLDSAREKGPAQDCSDYMMKSRRNGVYRVTPHPKNNTFPVLCDIKSGGWTLIQHRFDGSTSFNRTWDEYKTGFGKLLGEFWLGNDKIHLLTKAKNMSLRIEIEDFEGVKEYAHYDHFSVANESQQYRLTIDGYSGTAGNAMQFSKKYNHDQKPFTTPDRDNDQYPSGNCGAYYSSGWWFDACMSANLNGKYYHSKYKGVRNGIFWGTWHNITMEYYPTNDRQSFKTVRMMIRPKNYAN